MTEQRKQVLSEGAVSTAHNLLWAVCIAVYLTVFIGGIQTGGAEILTMGRAVGFTLAVAVLGKMAIGLVSRASLPEEKGPSADELGQVGSLAELTGSGPETEAELSQLFASVGLDPAAAKPFAAHCGLDAVEGHNELLARALSGARPFPVERVDRIVRSLHDFKESIDQWREGILRYYSDECNSVPPRRLAFGDL